MMRIVLTGQAAFGAKVLQALVEKGENVVAVYVPPEKPGGRPDPLKEGAIASNIPVYQPASYKDDEAFEQYKQLNPDLSMLAFVTDIIPERFFAVPTHGAICYHPSLLPRHRGASAINWAVIMGDKRTGLSVFWPDGGIDTGPVLLQKEIAIGPEDTTGGLYFDHLFPMGIDALVESVTLIKEGKAPKIRQDESAATYEPPCDDSVGNINWSLPANELYNLVRGCDPQPGAFVMFKGEKLRFYGSKMVEQPTDKAPGTVLQIDDQGVHTAISGGEILVSKLKLGPGEKLPGAEFAAEQGLREGDFLGG